MKKSIEERFEAGLLPANPDTGCIEWGRNRHRFGHGRMSVGGVSTGTHRIAYELKHGPIPEGIGVLHECDNPPCCNDAHLFLGTKTDNADDRHSKGRTGSAKGQRNGMAKLTEKDVSEIRRRLASGDVQQRIADDFGVAQATVSHIKNAKNWTPPF